MGSLAGSQSFGSPDNKASNGKKMPLTVEVHKMNSDGAESDSGDSAPDLDLNIGPPIPTTIEEVISDEMSLEAMAEGIARLIMMSASDAAVRAARKSTRALTPRAVSFRERQASIIEIAGRPPPKPAAAPVHGW